MAKEALVAVDLEIGGTDYSDEVSSVSLPVSVDELASDNFAGSGWKEMVAGLKGAQVTINFRKDADMSGLDAAIWAALGTSVALTVQKDGDSAIGATNPQYQFNCIVSQWDPISGAVGALHENSVTWSVTGVVTRDVTP
jgi:hypothetical protein